MMVIRCTLPGLEPRTAVCARANSTRHTKDASIHSKERNSNITITMSWRRIVKKATVQDTRHGAIIF